VFQALMVTIRLRRAATSAPAASADRSGKQLAACGPARGRARRFARRGRPAACYCDRERARADPSSPVPARHDRHIAEVQHVDGARIGSDPIRVFLRRSRSGRRPTTPLRSPRTGTWPAREPRTLSPVIACARARPGRHGRAGGPGRLPTRATTENPEPASCPRLPIR